MRFKHSPSPARHRLKQPVRKGCAAVNDEKLPAIEQPMERQIGNTTYILTAKCNPNAREGLLDKIWRLIQQDNDESLLR